MGPQSPVNERDAVRYLLERGLLGTDAVVDGGVVVVRVSRRNENFRIVCDRGPSYFLKHGTSQDRRATIGHEARVYARLSRQRELQVFLPHLYDYDEAASLLVLELFTGAEDLREYRHTRARFSTLQARALGRALACVHRTALDGEPLEGEPDPRSLPWVLNLHRPGFATVRELSAGTIALLKLVQRFPEFGRELGDLRAGWQRDAFIHGDLKSDNFIARASKPGGRKTSVALVDWEVADIGDSCWDVGSVLADFLAYWVTSIPVAADTSPERVLELARYPLERIHPAISAFWHSYALASQGGASAQIERLPRAVRYCGARLLQTAFEQMQSKVALTSHAICLLQVALNVMQEPRRASAELFGLRSGVPA